jgi:23S rRNA pseudouridine955/2504/2580 synthase
MLILSLSIYMFFCVIPVSGNLDKIELATAVTGASAAATVLKATDKTKNTTKQDEITVPKDYHDARLDRFLRNYYKETHRTHLSVTQIQKFIRKKQILVNGKAVTEANARVEKSNVVTVPHELVPQLYLKDDANYSRTRDTHVPLEKKKINLTQKQIEEIRSWVLFMNEEVIVLNKPHGIAVQGGSKQKIYVDGMLHALRYDRNEDPRLVHRLDKDTSGVLVVARNREGSHRMQQWLMDKTLGLKKCYWCIVSGKPKPSTGRIKNFLEKASTKTFGEKVYVHQEKTEGSKIAITEYKIIESVGEAVSWLAMYPVTGRLHQLRVHCSSTLGTPILGDEKYGQGVPEALKSLYVEGTTKKRNEIQLHLHARAMVLPYTDVKGERIIVTAPLPQHMKDTLNLFGIKEKGGNKLMFK